MMLMRSEENNPLQWLDVLDDRFEWLNVADWEPQNGGLQPVRVPKFWRDQWPSRTARRGKSAAGVALLRTDRKRQRNTPQNTMRTSRRSVPRRQRNRSFVSLRF